MSSMSEPPQGQRPSTDHAPLPNERSQDASHVEGERARSPIQGKPDRKRVPQHETPCRAEPTATEAQPAPRADDVERLAQEAKSAQERYLRMLAEFENTKKRLHREKEEFVRYAAESIVRELLPIMDSLDQALVAVDKQSDPQAIIKGVHLIYRQLLGLLEKEGVKRIPTIGERFDPHQHEAVAQVDGGDGVGDGEIVEEAQVGYTMHGKVIRPSMVKVAQKNSPQSTVDSPQQEHPEQEG